MIPYKCCCFSIRSAQGQIQSGAKMGHEVILLQRTSSSDPKARGTGQMYNNDVEACGNESLVLVKFMTRFLRFFGLSHLAYFKLIFIDCCAVKRFICIYFVYFPWFLKRKKRKRRDLTQSYDKNPYTDRKIIKATWQHKNATKNFDYTTIRAVSLIVF